MTEKTGPTTAAQDPGDDPRRDENVIPGRAVALVLLLLLAVIVTGGLVVRQINQERAASDPTAVAISRHETEVEANPADTGARLSLAYAFQQASRYDEAVAQYDRVLQTDPKDLAALYNRGVIAAARGDGEGAAAWWSKTLAVDPAHVLAAKSLGEYLAAAGRYRALVDAVRPAADANPTLADLQYLMGLGYEKMGDAARARERYRAALRYSPEMTEALSGLERVGGGAP